MAKLSRKAGSTSEIWQIFIQDSSSLTGAGLTGLLNNTTSLTAYFHRDTDTTATVINLASMTAGTFTSSGFIEIDATNMPGCYQFCPPNTALAAGAKSCLILLKGAANMAPVVLEVDLLNDSNVVWWNGTVVSTPATAGIPDVNVKNINNVVAATPGATGGLQIAGANAATTYASLTCTGALTVSDGIAVACSTTDRSAITATGNGTGSGVIATSGSGATGDGFQATSVATNGNGFVATGKGSGNAIKAVSISGDAILTSVSTSGHGATFAGTGTTKHGINAAGGATTSHGIAATGGGVGHGILATSGGGATGDGIKAVSAASNGNGFNVAGVGTGAGLLATGGATGSGLSAVGGASSGSGIKAVGTAGNAIAMELAGQGSAAGLSATGGATGNGMTLVGGGTSGHGLGVTTTSGDGFNLSPTAGNGLLLQANGTSKHGLVATGGTGGTSDGIKGAAGTGGVDIRGAITGNITGSLSGSAGSVTGAVGSVTGAVGSVTGNVGGNVTGSVGSVATGGIAAASFAAGAINAAAIAADAIGASELAADAVTKIQNGLATPTNITAGTITTVTNVTNRVTANTDQVAGDATAATNLASTFNGTGYTAATAPATQSQVSNIAVTGAALNATAASRTLTTGTETNAYTDTFTDDGVYHTITQAGGAIDIYYEFSLGSTGQTGVGAFWQGYVAGIVNSMKVYAYNWGNAAWDQIGTLLGISNTVAADADFALTNDHTGTGGNLGKVRIRFSNTGLTAATLNTDRMLLGYAVVVSYPSNFSALAISAGGHISNVDTLTTYTGDTPQTGDSYAKVNDGTIGLAAIKGYVDDIGVAGAGLTALGDARIANLDAAVSTRSTYAGGAVASVTGAVGSVTGNVGGNVVGSVGSVTAAVTIAAASVQAIWDALTSALTTVGSIGKLLVDNINATISSRLASGTVASDVTAIKAKTDNLPAAPAATSDCITAAGVRSAVGLASANLDTQIGTLATPTNITAGTLTTVTNLTNAPTAGDLTAAMKASVTAAATAATPTVATVSGAVGSVTGNVGGNVTGSVGSLATQAKADVNAEVVDCLNVDTYAEPTGAPAATVSLAAKISRIYQALRNKLTVSSSSKGFCDDSGSALWSKSLADDGTTYTENEGS